MKIAILVPAFPPKWIAGTEIATYNIARHLAKRGNEVHVITSLDEGLPQEAMEQGFYIHVWGRGSDIDLPWRCAKSISNLVLPNASAVIALTEDMKRGMLKTCNRDIYVIPNGIDLEKFEGLSKEKTATNYTSEKTKGLLSL